MFHLSRVLRRATELYADRMATSDGGSTLTYRDLGERAGRLAAGMQARGIVPGDRIILIEQNSLQALEINFACAAIGAILVPLNTRLAAREIAQIVAETEASIVLASDAFAHLVPSTIDSVLWPAGYSALGRNAYEELACDEAPLANINCSQNDIAQIFYTSGTTGQPKGVCLTHGNLVASAYDAIVALSLGRDDVWLHAAPMFHLVDAFAIWAMTLVGGVHAIAHFQPARFADVVATLRVTKTSLPPTLIAMAIDNISAGDKRLASLTRISYGGSPMTESLHKRATDILGVELLQAYGITETSGIVAHQLPGDYSVDGTARQRDRLGSVGQATTSIAIRIVDGDGHALAGDGPGEIHVSGPRVMAGYWGRPDATNAVLNDGWYATGDLGRRDADGHLFIVGRKKDMIITGGENVYPIEVENALAAHPAVGEVAVFGVASERWGEEVRAAIVVRDGHAISEAELILFCRERIGGYKIPKAIEFYREPLPTTGPGKVAKHVLRAASAAR